MNDAEKITGGTFVSGIVGGYQFNAGDSLLSDQYLTTEISGNSSETILSNITGNFNKEIVYDNGNPINISNNKPSTDDVVCYVSNSEGITGYYETLKDAVEKANNESKIILKSNVDLSEGFVLNKSLTLDMAGCKITCTNQITVFTTTSAITLDLMNSSETESLIDGTCTDDTSKCQLANFNNASAKLIFDKGVKYTGGKGIEVYGGQLIISGSIKADSPAVLVSGSGAKLTFANGKIEGGSSTLNGASAEYTGGYVRN